MLLYTDSVFLSNATVNNAPDYATVAKYIQGIFLIMKVCCYRCILNCNLQGCVRCRHVHHQSWHALTCSRSMMTLATDVVILCALSQKVVCDNNIWHGSCVLASALPAALILSMPLHARLWAHPPHHAEAQ